MMFTKKIAARTKKEKTMKARNTNKNMPCKGEIQQKFGLGARRKSKKMVSLMQSKNSKKIKNSIDRMSLRRRGAAAAEGRLALVWFGPKNWTP